MARWNSAIAFLLLTPGALLTTPGEAQTSSQQTPTHAVRSVRIPDSVTLEELLNELDKVQSRGGSNKPGGASFAGDPIFEAICRKGSEAVEPMLNAYESDKRPLTSAVPNQRVLSATTPTVGTVSDMAYQTLIRLLDDERVPTYPRMTTEQLRGIWNEDKSETPGERHMKVLADDSAKPEQWLAAAQRLSSIDPSVSSLAMVGDSVRSRTSPSVTDLMIRRAKNFATPDPIKPWDDSLADHAAQMAVLLAKWDPKSALPILRFVSQDVMEPDPGKMSFCYSGNGALRTQLIEERVQLGDKAALKDYAAWISAVAVDPRADLGFNAQGWFAPLADHPDDPELKQIVSKLSKNPDSCFAPEKLAIQTASLAASPLLAYPDFVKNVIAALDDKTILGHVSRHGRSISYQGTGRIGGNFTSAPLLDPPTVKDDDPVDLRTCDDIADMLAGLRGAPRMRPYWPAGDKDKVIDQLKTFLSEHDGHLVELLPFNLAWRPFSGRELRPPSLGQTVVVR